MDDSTGASGEHTYTAPAGEPALPVTLPERLPSHSPREPLGPHHDWCTTLPAPGSTPHADSSAQTLGTNFQFSQTTSTPTWEEMTYIGLEMRQDGRTNHYPSMGTQEGHSRVQWLSSPQACILLSPPDHSRVAELPPCPRQENCCTHTLLSPSQGCVPTWEHTLPEARWCLL